MSKCRSSELTTGNYSPFFGLNTNQIFIYVPQGSKEYYAKANVWSDFTCIREEGEGNSESASGGSNRCAKPQVTFANKTLTLSCSTANAEIHYSYYLSNAGTVKSSQQVPTVTKTTNSLTVIAYATADNYAQSETVMQTFPFDATSYDVNGDNKLTVADVTSLIDIIVNQQ